jgi:TPR repeat protein
MRKLLITLAAILMLTALDAAPAFAQADATELSFWESVRDSDQPQELEAYLKAYPDGMFAPLARIRIEKLKGSDASEPAQPEPARSSPSEKEAGATEEASELEPAASSPPVHECDRLAAHPLYTAEGISGIDFDDIPSDEAIRACRAAVVASPETERFQFQLARALLSGKVYEESRRRFRVLAEKGHVGAALNLGLIYGHGRGVPKDYAQAARWLRQASDDGDPVAMIALGYLYKAGLGVEQSDQEAVAWFRKAMEKNEPDGFSRLASMYAEGRGVPKDMKEAARLHRQAADMGLVESMYVIGKLYADGEGVSKDEAEAIRWYKRAAEKGSIQAMTDLGYAFHAGRGTDKDLSQAVEWYRKAADKGEATAKNNLGMLYNDGTGVPRDGKEAARLLLEAYRGGDAYAKRNLEEQSGVLSIETRRELQRLMKQEGVYNGKIDGRFGSGTKAALKALAPVQDAAKRVRASSTAADKPEDLGDLQNLGTLD